MTYQLQNQPLFPDFLWAQPEKRSSKAELLIIGGYAGNLKEPPSGL